MRFLILGLVLFGFCRCYGSGFTLLDATCGVWDSSVIFQRMLDEKVSLLPEKYSIALEKCAVLPEKLSAAEIAVVAASADELKGKELNYRLIGKAAIVVAAGKDCPLENISIEDLQRIYSGRAASWARFGGRDIPIRLGGYAAGTPQEILFSRLVMGRKNDGKTVDLNSQIAPGMLVCGNVAGCRGLLSVVPGIIVFGSADLLLSKTAGFKVLKINGVPPDAAAVADGSYPLAMPLGVVSGKNVPEEIVKNIADFLQSTMQKKLN